MLQMGIAEARRHKHLYGVIEQLVALVAEHLFDLAVDDDVNGGPRDAQLMWIGTDQAFADTSFYDSITLK